MTQHDPYNDPRWHDGRRRHQLTGPGGCRVRGIDPLESDDIAQRRLMQIAEAASYGLMPVADLTPTDSVPISGVAVGATSTVQVSIQWPSNGLVVGIRATVRDGTTVSANSTLFRVQIDGDTELFPSSTGSGPGFIPFAHMSGNSAFFGRYSTRREFKQSTNWAAFIQNTQATGIVADVTLDIIRTSNLRTG